MNIHEYQAKVLFRKFGIRVPNGDSVTTVDRGMQVAETLRAPYVVKAQIHAGGRGAGKIKDDPSGKGGVRIASSVDEVRAHVNSMLGKVLITKQTGSEGKTVNSIYIEEACNIERELYLSFLVDRNKRRICVIASTEGGMDIEEIAVTAPKKIKKIFIDPITGMMPFHARSIAFFFQLKDKQISECVQFLTALYQAFVSLDASLVEINPLVLTKEGHLLALDAKVSFDDNALFRHPDILRLRDKTEDDPMEVQASEYGLNYVKLHGNIGCMVNGAGLAMATMDIIQLKGASPANFLDVGGGADKERVKQAFQILLSDSSVKGILVNIFGGIMRCDIIANGILEAIKEIKLSVPVVVRLEGTNVEKGKSLLAESGLAIIPANNLDDAAEKIVQSIQ